MPRRVKRYRRRVLNIQSKRPIDKGLISGIAPLTGPDQYQARILPLGSGGVAFPGTVTGIRWAFNYETTISTAVGNMRWAIIKCREGTTPNGIDNGAIGPVNFYIPEQDVIAWGQIAGIALTNEGTACSWQCEGSTKSMRKLQNGDALWVVINDDHNESTNVAYIIQYFYKT